VYLDKKLERKKTLVIDLDETLVHCVRQTHELCDVIIPILYTDTNEIIKAGINIRPFC